MLQICHLLPVNRNEEKKLQQAHICVTKLPVLNLLPYFVYDGSSARRTNGHGHHGPGDSNSRYNKDLGNNKTKHVIL